MARQSTRPAPGERGWYTNSPRLVAGRVQTPAVARQVGTGGMLTATDNTGRGNLARDTATAEGVAARKLGAGGSLTNQRLQAPPGDVKGIEHDPATSQRLARHPSSTQSDETRNRDRPIAQKDPGNSRPLNQRNPRANDGTEDRRTSPIKDTTRRSGADDVSRRTQSVGNLSDQYVPTRGSTARPAPAADRTRPANVGGHVRPVRVRSA